MTEVRELRAGIAARKKQRKKTPGAGKDASAREALRKDKVRLAHLEAMAPMTAEQMCSECPWPAAWHTQGFTYGLDGKGELSASCSGWPRWGGNIRKMKQELAQRLAHPPSPPPPPLRPLAVIRSGLPIEEVMAQLAAVGAEHPRATVRQGRNRWEVWPAQPSHD